MNNYKSLQIKIVVACQQAEAIQALILVGSRARKDRPLDEHADLDYILLTPDLDAIKTIPDWISGLAPVWVPDYSFTGAGDPEWMVIYEGGYKVDYTFHKIQSGQTVDEVLRIMPYQAVLFRGFEVLLDKTASQGHITWEFDMDNWPGYPSAEQFTSMVDNFLLEASRAARFIDRADLWRAKVACDTDLKQRLLTMVEWQARSKNGLRHDTWYDGRYLSEWADPLVTATLPETFGAYQKTDLQRAFRATLTLYDQLAGETAVNLGFQYPTPGQQAAITWLKTF